MAEIGGIMDKDDYKLKTRRWLAWVIGGMAGATAVFCVVYGAINDQLELVTLGAGCLFTNLGYIINYLFKKTSEE